MKTPYYLIMLLSFTLMVACNNDANKNPSGTTKGEEGMTLTVDGETYRYETDDIVGQSSWHDDAEVSVVSKIRTRLDKPVPKKFTMNLTMYSPDYISRVPDSFEVNIDPNQEFAYINLNIVDNEQTLFLTNGKLTIHKWTADYIHYEFEGVMGQMLNSEITIPVSGIVKTACGKY
mgnify:CR=1 FL=1